MATPGRAGWDRQRPVRLDGLTDLRNTLDALPEAFRAEMAETIADGAGIIESEAKGRVPIDEGDLYDSIATNIREDGMQAAVGSDLIYSRFVELGWANAPAQPWLYPAFLRGARFVRKQMRAWAEGAGKRVRFKTKRRRR